MKLVTAFKHLFIPHEHNDYRPHFFREVSVVVILASSLFMLGFSAGSSFLIHETVLGANISASVLVDLTNESRLAFNEEPLVRNPVLDRAAELKAEDMAKEGYFSHTSPEGITPWYWFRKVGYTFLYAGENLAINFVESEAVQNAWLQSPTHRANLLDVKFKEIGMATVGGVYKNGPSIYVVQMFGTPAKAAVARATATTSDTVLTGATNTKPKLPAINSPAQTPEVKGEAASSAPVSIPAIVKPVLEPIITTSELAIVKNTEDVNPVVSEAPVEKYSKWYERFLFGGSYYVDLAYKALFALVLIALLSMVFIEVRRQHWKHIVYGLSLLLVLTLSLLINQSFF